MSLELHLNYEVASGNLRGVHDVLTAGACVDGSRDLPTRPLVIAAEMGRVDVLGMLIGRGADLEVTVPGDNRNEYGFAIVPRGSRALHAAVIMEQVGSVRCLLKAGAKPDVLDSRGFTPLMLAYHSSEIVAELLKGGANPAFSNGNRAIALHMHASNDAPDEAMRLLLEAAPSTLNQVTKQGYTPLGCAAEKGIETSVAFLLAAGASDKAIWAHRGSSSLWVAVEKGYERVVRMIVDAGMDVIGGGSMAILGAMCRASQGRMARILDILMGVEGDARKQFWAREVAGNIPILHHAAMYGSLAAVQVCLAAGADENFVNATGMRVADLAGVYAPSNTKHPGKLKAAIGRLLLRGSACRARSWAWPLKTDASGGKKKSPPTGVRVFRPRNDRLLTTRFARYSKK